MIDLSNKKIEVVEKSPNELRLDFGNPRTITPEELENLKRSLSEFDDFGIIVINEKDQVLAGNQRVTAMRELGWKKPILCKRLVGFSAAEQKAINIRSNRSSGEFDEAVLLQWIDDIRIAEIDINLAGFTDIEVQEFQDLSAGQETEDTEGDDEAEEIDKCITKAGDLWELNGHRILCGDSTIEDDVIKLLDEDRLDMVFTDPPYGVAIGSKNQLLDKFDKAERQKKNIKGDTLTPGSLKKMLLTVFKNIKKYSKDRCSYYVTAPQGGGLGMMRMMMMAEAGLPARHVLIWIKNRACFSLGRLDYEYQHEPILYTWNKTHQFYGKGKHSKSIWFIDKETKCNLHPTMKPVELPENAILNSSIL
jgi:hypothetical protein